LDGFCSATASNSLLDAEDTTCLELAFHDIWPLISTGWPIFKDEQSFTVWVVLEWECLQGANRFTPSKLDDTQLDPYLPEFMVIMVKIMTFEFEMRDVFSCGLFCGVENHATRFSSAETFRVHVASRLKKKLKKIISNFPALQQ
jgi:hypothetical protein